MRPYGMRHSDLPTRVGRNAWHRHRHTRCDFSIYQAGLCRSWNAERQHHAMACTSRFPWAADLFVDEASRQRPSVSSLRSITNARTRRLPTLRTTMRKRRLLVLSAVMIFQLGLAADVYRRPGSQLTG